MTAACSRGEGGHAECADVVAVAAVHDVGGTVTLEVTIRSDDVGWEGYADRWEVVADGVVIGERVLTHPTWTSNLRSRAGIATRVGDVIVRAHHSMGDYCCEQAELSID